MVIVLSHLRLAGGIASRGCLARFVLAHMGWLRSGSSWNLEVFERRPKQGQLSNLALLKRREARKLSVYTDSS